MLRLLFRIVGFLLLALAMIALVLDGVAYVATGQITLMDAGRTWTELSPTTLNQAQFILQEHLGLVWFWDQIIVWVLLQPTFAVLAVLGLFFCFIGRKKRRRGPKLAM